MEMCHGYLDLQECIILFEVEINATYYSESTKGSNMDLKDPIGNIQNGNFKQSKITSHLSFWHQSLTTTWTSSDEDRGV